MYNFLSKLKLSMNVFLRSCSITCRPCMTCLASDDCSFISLHKSLVDSGFGQHTSDSKRTITTTTSIESDAKYVL
jgi:hypothetical protein